MKTIESIKLESLQAQDYAALRTLMMRCYPNLPDAPWQKKQLDTLTSIFPEGQIVIKADGELVACALSMIIPYKLFEDNHDYAKLLVITPSAPIKRMAMYFTA